MSSPDLPFATPTAAHDEHSDPNSPTKQSRRAGPGGHHHGQHRHGQHRSAHDVAHDAPDPSAIDSFGIGIGTPTVGFSGDVGGDGGDHDHGGIDDGSQVRLTTAAHHVSNSGSTSSADPLDHHHHQHLPYTDSDAVPLRPILKTSKNKRQLSTSFPVSGSTSSSIPLLNNNGSATMAGSASTEAVAAANGSTSGGNLAHSVSRSGTMSHVGSVPATVNHDGAGDQGAVDAVNNSDFGVIEIDHRRNVVLYHGDEAVESPHDILLAPEPTDARLGSRHPGLSSDEASRRLSQAAELALDSVTERVWSTVPSWKTFIFRIDLLITLMHIATLVIGLAVGDQPYSQDPPPLVLTGRIVELAILVALVAWNALLFYAQVEAPARQVLARAKNAIELLSRAGLNTVQEIKIPSVPSAPIVKVIRDGVIRSLPAVLLVEGDIVELHYGDIAPAGARYVYVTKAPPSTAAAPNGGRPEYKLDGGQGFRPTLFGLPPSPLMQLESQLNHGRFQFELVDTPVIAVLNTLVATRPKTVMTRQLIRLQSVLNRILCLVYVLSLAAALTRYLALKHTTFIQAFLWAHDIVLPLIPLLMPTMYLAFRSFSNAHIAVLWQELQTSKTDYEDVDQDEFDVEAPPPTKDVTLAKFDVLAQALRIDTSDLTESLGSITVLCFVDREGTLTEAFPSVDQIWLPNAVLDVSAAPDGRYIFEDRDWMDHMPLLKPLGLAWMTLTHCDLRKLEPHRNLCGLHIHAHTKASRQTCLCPLARQLGFIGKPEALVPVREVIAFAPYHASLDSRGAGGAGGGAGEGEEGGRADGWDGGADAAAVRSGDISEGGGGEHVQLLSASSGGGGGMGAASSMLSTNARSMSSLLALRRKGTTASANGSANGAAAGGGVLIGGGAGSSSSNGGGVECTSVNEGADVIIEEYDPYHAPADPSGNIVLNLPDYEFEVPFVHSVVLRDTRSGFHQLMSVGSVASVLDVCTDAWLGSDLAPLTDEQELALVEWYWNTTMNDHQVLAYAYKPILDPITCLPEGDRDEAFVYIELPHPANASREAGGSSVPTSRVISSSPMPPPRTTDSPEPVESPTLMSSSPTPPPPTYQQHSSSSSTSAKAPHHAGQLESVPEKAPPAAAVATANSSSSSLDPGLTGTRPRRRSQLTRPINAVHALTQNQIFLGLVAFAHEPKEDVCDAVEDVALAGIRFVYFSPTNERQTKAFGERLGLDTDWNSCILLSKPTDPHASPTYMERTDIKARLPRGVDAIREHLRDVDDIPLHVSLFAESSPPTVAGMLRVFQEHGEVVCAMGSTLNPANAEIFCSADLAVGVEPVHIKHQNQYAAGHVPPLALGSTLVSLPCPLVMHPDTSLYALTQLAREARRLCRAARQAFMLVAATCGLVAMVQLFTVVSLLPVWRGWILMWLVWVALPLVAVTYASNVHEVDTMKEFTERNLDHVKDLPRFLRYFVWRFLLPCVLTVWLYGVAQSMTLPAGAPWTDVFVSQASLEAEIVGGTCVAVFLLFASLTMLHRTLPFWEYRPLQNKFYCALVVVMLAVHFGIAFAVAMPLIAKLPWHFHAVFFGSLPVQVAVHEQVKKWDRRQWLRFQKRSKLEFNTRLGMHSPI